MRGCMVVAVLAAAVAVAEGPRWPGAAVVVASALSTVITGCLYLRAAGWRKAARALGRPVPGLTRPRWQYYLIFAGLVGCPVALVVVLLTGHLL